MDTGAGVEISGDPAEEAHGAHICLACGRPLRGKQRVACSAACRARASRARKPDPLALFRHALETAPEPFVPGGPARNFYGLDSMVKWLRAYQTWHNTDRATALD